MTALSGGDDISAVDVDGAAAAGATLPTLLEDLLPGPHVTASENAKAASGRAYAQGLREDAVAGEQTTRGSRLPRTLLFADVTSLFGAALLAGQLGPASSALALVLAYPALTIAMLAWQGGYRHRLWLRVTEDIRIVLLATAAASMLVLGGAIVTRNGDSVAAHAVAAWPCAVLFLACGRAWAFRREATARREGASTRRTLIVGAGRVGQITAERLLERPELGLRPIGFLDKDPLCDDGLPVLGASWDLERIVKTWAVEQVVLSFSTAPTEVGLRVIEECARLNVDVFVVPRFFERTGARLVIEHIGGLPLLAVARVNPRSTQFAVKHALDRLVAALLLLALLPVLVTVSVAVLRSLGRPILFRQTRIGRDGVPFEMLKFRTMANAPDPEQETSAALVGDDVAPGGVEGADRRTRVGVYLRRTSLDELPQLVNVVRGEMSIVGPRPERPEFVNIFERSVHRYSERHRVKVGITGWAQINGLRGKTSISQRAEWDNFYIDNWSLGLDLSILLGTAKALAGTRTVE